MEKRGEEVTIQDVPLCGPSWVVVVEDGMVLDGCVGSWFDIARW